MKKNLCICLLTLFIIFLANFMIIASNENVILFEGEETKDLQILGARAKEGITDLAGFKFTDVNNSLCTVQKLKTEQTADGKIINSYVATEFIPMGYGEQCYETSWDPTYSAQFAIKVYFDSSSFEVNHVQYEMYDVDKVQGVILQHVDPTVIRRAMSIKIHNFGHRYRNASLSDYLGVATYTDDYWIDYPGVNVWYTLYDGESDVFYDCAPESAHVACQVKLFLERGVSNWDEYINFIKGSFLSW